MEAAKKKFKGLKDTFRKELKKVPKGRSGDAGLSADQYQSTWTHFKQLFFLKDQIIGRASSGNLSNVTQQELSETQDNENDADGFDLDPVLSEQSRMSSPSPSCSSSGSVTKARSTKRKISSTCSFELQQQMLEIEKEKLKALTNPASADDDDDVKHFCLSLVPKIKKLSPEKQSLFCLKVQEMLHNYLYPPVQAPVPQAMSGLVQFSSSSTGNQFPNTGNQAGSTYDPFSSYS